MTRMDMDRTRAVRAWLAGGSEELSPRVRDDVLREFPLMSQDRPHWAAPWLQAGSFAVGAAVGAAAVTLVIAMIGAGLPGGIQLGGTGATPTLTPSAPPSTQALSPTPRIDRSYRDVGFIGLPPRGATPSDPTEAELVEVFWWPGGPPYKGAAFVYADGRLIWNEYFGDNQSWSTGWFEQSLTDEGIELVRALAIESVPPRRMDPAELPGRLPDDAWVDKAVRPYVPSGFAVCLIVTEQLNPSMRTEANMTLPEKLAVLPPSAADLLRDRPPVPSTADAYGPEPHDCLGLDLADARRLDAALREAELEQDAWRNRYLLEYHVQLDRPEEGIWWLGVWFEPILPDGTITCSSCG